MRSSLSFILVAAMLVGASPVLAQPQPDSPRERRGDRRDRRQDGREEAGEARGEHRERMEDARREHRGQIREDRRDGRGLTPEERRAAGQELREEGRDSRQELREDLRDVRQDAREERVDDARDRRRGPPPSWTERRRVRTERTRDRAAFDAMRVRLRREQWQRMQPVVEVQAPPPPTVVVVPNAPPPPPRRVVVRIRPEARAEMRLHAERVAELERIREMALQKNDAATAAECDVLVQSEQGRHVSLMASFGVVIR